MSARVLITGAAGGIGAAAAAELRARGARVVGLDLRGDPEGDVIAWDVRHGAAVERAVAEAVERLGGLDVLINNAGIGTPQGAGSAPEEGALAVIDVNMLGPWRVTAAALPALRAAGGRVVNVASGLAVGGREGHRHVRLREGQRGAARGRRAGRARRGRRSQAGPRRARQAGA